MQVGTSKRMQARESRVEGCGSDVCVRVYVCVRARVCVVEGRGSDWLPKVRVSEGFGHRITPHR